MAELAPHIKEIVQAGGQFQMKTRGHSMEPTLIDGKSIVTLTAPTDLKVGDIVLFERQNDEALPRESDVKSGSKFVLHRIVAVNEAAPDSEVNEATAVNEAAPGNETAPDSAAENSVNQTYNIRGDNCFDVDKNVRAGQIIAKVANYTTKADFNAVFVTEQFAYVRENITNLFNQVGIDHIFLKGVVIREFYPERWMRTSADLDLLVREEQYDLAIETLKKEYTLEGKGTVHAVFKTMDGLTIELHHTLIHETENPASAKVTDRVWDDARPARIARPSGAGAQTAETETRTEIGAQSSGAGAQTAEIETRTETGARSAAAEATAAETSARSADTTRASATHEYEMSPEMFIFYYIAHMVNHFESGSCGIKSFSDLWYINRAIENGLLERPDSEKLQAMLEESGLVKFYEVANKLVRVWYLEEEYDELTKKFEKYVLTGGMYGTLRRRVIANRIKMENAESRQGRRSAVKQSANAGAGTARQVGTDKNRQAGTATAQPTDTADKNRQAGADTNRQPRAGTAHAGFASRLKYIIERANTPYTKLVYIYPVLRKQRWLTPACRVLWWFKNSQRAFSEIRESRKATNESIREVEQLLKELELADRQ